MTHRMCLLRGPQNMLTVLVPPLLLLLLSLPLLPPALHLPQT